MGFFDCEQPAEFLSRRRDVSSIDCASSRTPALFRSCAPLLPVLAVYLRPHTDMFWAWAWVLLALLGLCNLDGLFSTIFVAEEMGTIEFLLGAAVNALVPATIFIFCGRLVVVEAHLLHDTCSNHASANRFA